MHKINISEINDIVPDAARWETDKSNIYILDENELKSFPERKQDSHKGTYGRVLIVAGSKDMGGAPVLCAEAALRSGAGIVKIFTHKENRASILARLPEAITICYSDDLKEKINVLKNELKKADSVVAGPGLSVGEDARLITDTVIKECESPLVADADMLNIISESGDDVTFSEKEKVILTPHIKEAARLLGKDAGDVKSDKEKAAREISDKYNAVAVLKDAVTFISDGENIFINTTGNSGMATAGSGDTLAGILGGLAARGLRGGRLAATGVYLHGTAGDKAAVRLGENAMIASDIVKALPDVIKYYEL